MTLMPRSRQTQTSFATHTDPVWREQSDFVIHAPIVAPGAQSRLEQLFVKRVGDLDFEVCCIPFFVYDIALGDVVHTSPQIGVSPHVVDRVVRHSGRYVFRAWFKVLQSRADRYESSSYSTKDLVTEQLLARNALVEWASDNLLAVDAADEGVAEGVAAFLQQQEESSCLIYETGRTR